LKKPRALKTPSTFEYAPKISGGGKRKTARAKYERIAYKEQKIPVNQYALMPEAKRLLLLMNTFVSQRNPQTMAANCKILESEKITGCFRKDA
jgi:hypothetical protein